MKGLDETSPATTRQDHDRLSSIRAADKDGLSAMCDFITDGIKRLCKLALIDDAHVTSPEPHLFLQFTKKRGPRLRRPRFSSSDASSWTRSGGA